MAQDYPGPIPKPTPETQPYWDGAKRHVLMVQRCGACGRHYFYPRPLCPHCLSRDVSWVQVSGRGRLHTFTINYRPPKKFPTQSPIIIGIVELEEGPRLMTEIVGATPDPATLRCDTPVEVIFEDITDDITLPKFRPAAG
jgi:uncharacterized OB-fold protein